MLFFRRMCWNIQKFVTLLSHFVISNVNEL